MKFGLLFSGQGSQTPGMGLDFLQDSLFKETIEQASQASGQDLVKVFASENDELKKTIHVQPALVAFEAGIYRMLKRDLPALEVKGMVGLSLGEYGAMFASGALDLAKTISLVSDRAKYMQEDADAVESGMAALVKPDIEQVETILAELRNNGKQVYLANFNTPKQVVIGGIKADLELAVKQIEAKKAAKKAVVLQVNGAFHTPLFNNASEKMHERLKQVAFNPNTISVISNTTGQPFSNNWSEIMEKQLAVPTHFGDCLHYLIDHEALEATLEIGPGKTLTTFAKRINPNLQRAKIGDWSEYQKFIEENHEN